MLNSLIDDGVAFDSMETSVCDGDGQLSSILEKDYNRMFKSKRVPTGSSAHKHTLYVCEPNVMI